MSRLASQVNSVDEIRAIFAAYRGNGGTMSYEQIERHFQLKETNGMTAYRIVQRARKLSQSTPEFEIRETPVEPKEEDEFDAVELMLASRAWRAS